ncbi:MAG: 50S ribosomal protein L29 [Chitinophagales bacterium]|nr:50S ribosomal protein L29 [Chitinophagales bacterium]
MAKKQSNEMITTKSSEELQEELAATKMKLQKMRFSHAISPIDNPKQLGVLRKEIARINTELRSRELTKLKIV